MNPVVSDSDGTLYVLEKRAAHSSRVYDPESGERLHLPTDHLHVLDAEGVPNDTGSNSGFTRDPGLGLLLTVRAAGPVSVRTLMDEMTMCESDLHGALAELVAGGLLREVTVLGDRGYEITDEGLATLETLEDG